MSRREDLETGLTSVAAAYTFQSSAPRYRHASWGKRGGRSGGSNHKEKPFIRHARAGRLGRKTTHLLVSVPRTFYTPLQVREPAEPPLSPSGVDSSLINRQLFTRRRHATCARTLPRYLCPRTVTFRQSQAHTLNTQTPRPNEYMGPQMGWERLLY
eukprot:scaffold4509_cov53-Phaeocystis_antarctica.AAC.1